MPANLENSAVATRLEKVSFIPISKKGNAKECSTTTQLHSSHTLVKQCSKFSKPGFSNTWTVNFQMFKLVLEKAEETDQTANIRWIIEKAREFQKNIYFCFIDYAKTFNCVDHKKLENSSRDGNTRPLNLPPEKSVCGSGSNSQNWTWNNRLVPNRKRSTSRLRIVTLLI